MRGWKLVITAIWMYTYFSAMAEHQQVWSTIALAILIVLLYTSSEKFVEAQEAREV